MKGLIIYDSFFGNTEKVAQKIAESLGTNVIKVCDAKVSDLEGLDYLIVGSPTRAFRPSKDITDFLKSIPTDGISKVRTGAFDTRIDPADVNNPILNIMVKLFGYADKPIANLLQKKGGQMAIPNAGFDVLESEGPLREGELERAAEWALRILD